MAVLVTPLNSARLPHGSRIKLEGEAEKNGSDFSSSVGVQVTSQQQVDAPPMTAETHAEAQVAVEASAETGGEKSAAKALAEAASLVDNDVASAILSGDTEPSEIASVAQSMEETREAYAHSAESSVDLSAVGEAKVDAYAKLQDALASASDEADRSEALAAFEENVSSAYTEGGASAEEQAEIEQAGTQVALEAASSLFEEAAVGLERRATILRALSTGASVKQSISANGASQAEAGFESARTDLTEAVRAASSTQEIQDATSAYRASVKTALETGFEVSSSDVEEGFSNLETALDNLDSTLSTAVSTTDKVEADADAVATAFENFYENGAQTVQGVYGDRGAPSAEAEASAEVTVKAAAF